jgi:hypothetical protein
MKSNWKWILGIIGLIVGGILGFALIAAFHMAMGGITSHYELTIQAVFVAPAPIGGAIAGFVMGDAIDRRSRYRRD